MAIVMGPNSYGKAEVRLVKVLRDGDRHDLCDLTVTVQLQGDFDDVYVAGDNSAVLPTDTMMRTAYALAQEDPMDSVEGFGLRLAAHFLQAAPAATTARVDLIRHPWDRVGARAFAGGRGTRSATVSADRDGLSVEAGIADLLVLKTGDSSFSGFLRDEYTVLEETDDRILATVLEARWSYAAADVEFDRLWHGVHQTVLETFAEHHSESVQHTVWVLGQAVLDRFDGIERIHLSLPNKHHLRVDGDVFHVTDRPYGVIEGTVRRR